MVLDQRIGDSEGVIAFLKSIIGSLQIDQGLFVLGIVVRSVYLDIESCVNDGNVNGLESVELFELRGNAFFPKKEIECQGVGCGRFDLVAKRSLAGDAEGEFKVLKRIMVNLRVNLGLAVAAAMADGRAFHWIEILPNYNV
jgi:hypothetical protein